MILHVSVRAWVTVGLLLVGGCGTGDVLSGEEPIETPAATYGGLAGQKCAILVWADLATRTEFNQVQLDLARALQGKLTPAESGKPESPSIQFLDPRSVVRYQREHPEIEGLPITEVAPHLGVPRVIYVEIEQLQTHSPRSILLLKGQAKATLRVVEVTELKARIAFEEAGITASYPRNAREGVVPTDKVDQRTVYEGTVMELAGKLAARLPLK